MREIKFRAWHKAEKRFINLNGMSTEFGTMTDKGQVYGITEQGVLHEYDKDEIELMQFTGLKDKHGKEIFEGDIVEWKHSEQQNESEFYKERRTIYFHNGSYGFEGWNTAEGDILNYRNIHHPSHFATPDLYYKDFDIEIIGNIYENPELK